MRAINKQITIIMKRYLRNAFRFAFRSGKLDILEKENEKLKLELNECSRMLIQAGEELQKLKLESAVSQLEQNFAENSANIKKEELCSLLKNACSADNFELISESIISLLEKRKRKAILSEFETKNQFARPNSSKYEPDRQLLHSWAQEMMNAHKCTYEEALRLIDKEQKS